MKKNKINLPLLLPLVLLPWICSFSEAQPQWVTASEKGKIVIRDKNGDLMIGIDCRNKCKIDNVSAMGLAVVSNQHGVVSSVKVSGKLYSTSAGIVSPDIGYEGEKVIIDNIKYGEAGREISERWIFTAAGEYIDWKIERTYNGNMTLEDTGFPEWSFDSMDTWTGALCGTGGVAWCRFFDKPDASLGNHTGKVTFWNKKTGQCLRIEPRDADRQHVAVRFSRQPDNRFTLNYSVTEDELRTKHFLARFINDRQDIWDEFDARGTVSITYRLSAMNYDKAYYRGDFKGLSNESVRSVLNTIARVGVIDEKLMGSNNWHLDMGFVCLHEQWIAQMGIAIDDPDYLSDYMKTLDYFRDNAMAPDGDVKDRWAYRIWDSAPGTFRNGFYECQWGDLLDANTDYVINVADLFQLNGDKSWVKSHKLQCEKSLEYLLNRDSDNNGLIEVFTGSHNEGKGSDWIDVIWASWENAFINAKFFYALEQWADVEEIAGDLTRAEYYRAAAERCRYRFNQPVSSGGFWDPEKNFYIYWRDRDGSAHGDNLVTPVNFMAIAYGICDDRHRRDAILRKIETLMQEEKLFMWPISFFPYRPDEGYKVNYPFPNYENGDIFLAWGEVGIRAYQDYDPSVPVKYIKNVLDQYEKDGLAYQRYRRNSREGAGNDILANNCMPVVGLYRDIYGIVPRFNRLYLDPHMTEELNGTKVSYRMRDQSFSISLSVSDYSVSTDSFTVRSSTAFGLNSRKDSLSWFCGPDMTPSLIAARSINSPLRISIISWNHDPEKSKSWRSFAGQDSMTIYYEISVTEAGTGFRILRNGKLFKILRSDHAGFIHFSNAAERGIEDLFEISRVE